jgi:hypothetical protein
MLDYFVRRPVYTRNSIEQTVVHKASQWDGMIHGETSITHYALMKYH